MALKNAPESSEWEVTFRFKMDDLHPLHRTEGERVALAIEASERSGLDPKDIGGLPRAFGSETFRGAAHQASLIKIERVDPIGGESE